MDQYKTEKAIEVMLAYVNGNSIEVRLNRPGCNWGQSKLNVMKLQLGIGRIMSIV